MTEFKKLGKNVKIYESAKIIKPEVIEIGDFTQIDDFTFINGGKGVFIGRYVHIACFVSIIGGGELYLGDYVGLAAGTRIITGTDTYYGGSRMGPNIPTEQRNLIISFIKIEKEACLGTNVIVHPGVTIGEGAVIGSNSLVLRDIEPWTVNVGSPCKPIKKRQKVRFEDL